MENIPWEGVIVVTWGTLFSTALLGVIATFRRLGGVESRTARLEELMTEVRTDVKEQGVALNEAMTDFRVHMAEEQASVHRLEQLIVKGQSREHAS